MKLKNQIIKLLLAGVVWFIYSADIVQAQIPSAPGWYDIPNTKLHNVCPPNGYNGAQNFNYPFSSNCPNVVVAWSGGIADTKRNRLLVWGGGHSDYYGNEVYSFDLNNLTMTRLNNPSPINNPTTGSCVSALSDGTPNARHTYGGLSYIANADKMYVFSGIVACPSGGGTNDTWTLDLASLQWKSQDPTTGSPPSLALGQGYSDYDPNTGNVFVDAVINFFSYNYASNTYTPLNNNQNWVSTLSNAVIDPKRKLFFMFGSDGSNPGGILVYDISSGSNYALQNWTSQATGCSALANSSFPGLAYDSALDRIVGWTGGDTVYLFNPDTKTCTSMTFPNGPGIPPSQGTHGRFRYFPALDAFALVNSVDQDAFILKLSSGSQTPPSNTTPPTVSITSPASGATVSGVITISATASDNVGVASVQFQVDGSNTGSALTAAPYTYALDTTLLTNAAHTITAVAKNAAGNATTSAGVSITVNNIAPPPPPPPPAAGDTITIYDTSGSAQTNRAVSAPRAFVQGEIPNFAQAVINGVGVLTQCDVKNRWPDGSLKLAIVSFVVPSIPANGSVTVSFSNQTSGNNTGFLQKSDLLGTSWDFDAQIRETGSVNHTLGARTILNNCSSISDPGNDPSGPSTTPCRYWIKGPIATAVIFEDRSTARSYDFNTDGGSGNPLHPIFECWFYPQGKNVDCGYTVENMWAGSIAANSMRDQTYAFMLTSGNGAPTTLFTQASFNHIGRSRWYKEYWAGNQAPSGINIDFNCAYMTKTQILPNYDCTLPISASMLSATGMNPNQSVVGDVNGAGIYPKVMDAGGAADTIGLMPLEETLYWMTANATQYSYVIGYNQMSGRVPFHYREADTNLFFDNAASVNAFGRVPSINARANENWGIGPSNSYNVSCGGSSGQLNLGPVSTDGWDTDGMDASHWPQFALTAYLTTGKFYYMEEAQLAGAYMTGWTYGCPGPNGSARGGSIGMYWQPQPGRGTAWAFRSGAWAWLLSPDSSPEQNYFFDKTQNHIIAWEGYEGIANTDSTRTAAYNHGVSMQEPTGPSPLHILLPGDPSFVQSPLDTTAGHLLSAWSPWEESYTMAVYGMARDFGLTSASSLLQWDASRWFHVALDTVNVNNIYLIGTYRIPTMLSSTNNWIQNYSQYLAGYTQGNGSGLPTSWSFFSPCGYAPDDDKRFEGLATLGFLYPYTVDGFKGSDAWNLVKSSLYNSSTGCLPQAFNTVINGDQPSPKWDILARTGSTIFPPPNTTPPTVSITFPTNGAAVAGNVTVLANASDNVAVANVQFKLDGANLGSLIISAPYSMSWNTALSATGAHTLTAVATNTSGNTATSTAVNVTVSSATILQVGPTRLYKTVAAASAAARDGNIIEIDSGVYSGAAGTSSFLANNLTVRGVGGGRAVIPANGAQVMGKGIWVVDGANFTAENIEFSGASVVDMNGAGIRAEGTGTFTVRNCYFHDNQDGILGPDAGDALIENSIFDHNGAGDGFSHNIYVGTANSLTFRYNYTHRAVVGHNLKTRAMTNFILYNRIMDESDGTASYDIDIPQGGVSYVIGNVIEKGPNANNTGIVAYAAESALNGALELYAANNTMINDRPAGATFLQLRTGTTAKAVNNIMYGPGTPWNGATPTASNNYIHTAYDNAPKFVNPGIYDFHLTSASPAGTGGIVDAGTPPGSSPEGFSLTPTSQYVYDVQSAARSVVGSAIDIGAFEFAGSTVTLPPPSVTPPPTVAITSPAINSPATALGTVGLAFSYRITATNNPTSFNAVGLPAGLSVNASNGLISGTPAAGGTSIIALSASNSGGTGTAALTLAVNVPSPPAVSILPLSTTTLSGTVTLAASASSNLGIASVQFLLDGSNLGSPITAPPFTLSWNTAQAAPGTHSLTAVATDTSGNKTTSAPITVTVVRGADATPGLRNALAYPNPAINTDPTIRSFLGIVGSVEITIFNASGRVIHSTTLTGAPTGIINGQYYYDYTWTGAKAAGVYFAVIHGKAADGSIIRARTKFAVIN